MLAPIVLALQAPTLELSLLPRGFDRLYGFSPQPLDLSPEKPASLKKAPEWKDARYGTIRLAGLEYLVAVEGKPDVPEGDIRAKMVVDANHNGDLTDDVNAFWSKQTYFSLRQNKELSSTVGEARILVNVDGRPMPCEIKIYPQGAENDRPGLLTFYCDYGYYGSATIGGKRHLAVLYDGQGQYGAEPSLFGPALAIDLDDDGRFDNGERFDNVRASFDIAGKKYKLTGAFGAFRLAPSG